MPIVGAIIVPHPPLILPAVGRGQEREIRATMDAYCAVAQQAAKWAPEALVVSTPHSVMYADYNHISPGTAASGDMGRFGAPTERLDVRYDAQLRRETIRLAEAEDLPAGTLGEKDPSLDHGSFIPLWFLRRAGIDCPILRVGLSGLPPLDHYRLGQCITRAADTLGRRIVFVASGDLSHKLKQDGPYGFASEGPEYDARVTRAMAAGDFMEFLAMDTGFCDRAAECGQRSFQIMAGALDGLAVDARLFSHEGPFGVGYAVAAFAVRGPDLSRHFGERWAAEQRRRGAERRAAEDAWVRLARASLEAYVKTGRPLKSLPEDLPGEMTGVRAGAFVSLHIGDELRGCIGTTAPTTPSVAWEIVQNAVSACARDPRFAPVRASELDSISISVDVLGVPEPINSPAQLDVKRYGVIVSCGTRRGLLLPDLEGVDSVARQIEIARQKGGIGAGEPYRLERFEVVRHT